MEGTGSATHGEPVPLPLRLSGSGAAELTVRSETGRCAVAPRRDGAGRAGKTTVTATPRAETTVWVTPLAVGDPLHPADRLVVEGPGGTHHVEVWTEPAGGQWRPAGKNGEPLDLHIVAVHAAHLRKEGGNEDLFWSPPRKQDKNGDPMPDPQHEGQWLWNLHKLDDIEIRTLDLRTLRTTARPMEAAGGPKSVNIFCGGAAHIPDGRLLIVGGHIVHPEHADPDRSNSQHMLVYDPAPDKGGWRQLPQDLLIPRWYPTVTGLPDGRVLVSGGSSQVLEGNEDADDAVRGYWNNINNDYEIFDPARMRRAEAGEVALVDTSQIPKLSDRKYKQQLATYPNVFVLPHGEHGTWVALIESNRAWLTRYHARQANPLERADVLHTMHTKGSRSYPTYGSAVLLPLHPDRQHLRILAVGGQHEDWRQHRSLSETQPATDTAEILDIDTTAALTGQRGWRPVQRLRHRRVLCDATLLADGQVLVSGGSQKGWGNQNHDFVYAAELFDPETETFAPAADANTDRRYHATALLQPDGTVLKAGSTGGYDDTRHPDGTYKYLNAHTDAERYYPPYLWRGPRPYATRADGPDGSPLRYGRSLVLRAQGPGVGPRTRAALIRLGSTTHGNEMDQRYVWLHTEPHLADPAHGETQPSCTLTVTPPSNPAAAPPGDYLLVVVDDSGVPSEGTTVRLSR